MPTSSQLPQPTDSPPIEPVIEPVIDIDEARRLLDALERDLQGAGGDAPDLELLREEVRELRQVLHAQESTPADLQTGLNGMRDRLYDFPEELKGDAFQAGRYLAELGRILGL